MLAFGANLTIIKQHLMKKYLRTKTEKRENTVFIGITGNSFFSVRDFGEVTTVVQQ